MLSDLDDIVDKVITDYAKNIRQQKVIPICKKYKLSFTSGMGTWCFENEKGDTIYDSDDEKLLYGKDFWDLCDYLNHATRHMPMSIGAYMDDYSFRRK